MVDASVYKCDLPNSHTCVTSVGGSEELCYTSGGFGASMRSVEYGNNFLLWISWNELQFRKGPGGNANAY